MAFRNFRSRAKVRYSSGKMSVINNVKKNPMLFAGVALAGVAATVWGMIPDKYLTKIAGFKTTTKNEAK